MSKKCSSFSLLLKILVSVALASTARGFQLGGSSAHTDRYNCRHRPTHRYSTSSSTEDQHNAPTESPQLKDNEDAFPASLLTSAVINVTYDGGHFYGWSASNDGTTSASSATSTNEVDDTDADADANNTEDSLEYSSRLNGASFLPPIHGQRQNQPHMAGRKRRRGKRIPGLGTTQVRSVEGVIAQSLAKVYGDVDIKRIQIEGCSRTDKGVHGQSMVALVYCLTEEAAQKAMDERQQQNDVGTVSKESEDADTDVDSTTETSTSINTSGIPGKRLPHPASPTDDSSFQRLPFNGDIDKLMFVMNRMLPPDVRISNIAPTPTKSSDALPFHPTLDARGKTYRYTLSIGHVHDPMRWRHVWHVDTYGKRFDIEKARQCAALFEGRHDFAAFRGTFRGSERKRMQSDTICSLSQCYIEREVDDVVDCLGDSPLANVVVGGNNEEAAGNGLEPLTTYTVTVTGDRFLYKQVRFLVGSIVSVGLGKSSLDVVRDALQNGTWEDEGPESNGKGKKNVLCAPSHGLCLTDVQFDDGVDFDWVAG